MYRRADYVVSTGVSLMTKTQLLKIIKETDVEHKLDKYQKFHVFVTICDGLLEQHRITEEQHTRWTNIY